MTVLLAVLIGLMIVAAAVALETRDRLSSIVALGAVGFLAAVAFLLLGAPDVAQAQIVVEILSFVLLLRVTAGAPAEAPSVDGAASGGAPKIKTIGLAVGAALAVAAAGLFAFSAYPALGQPAMVRGSDAPSLHYLEHALSETGAANVVSSVLLDFRAYDTLGEATVLFCAVIGALVVMRKRARTAAMGGSET